MLGLAVDWFGDGLLLLDVLLLLLFEREKVLLVDDCLFLLVSVGLHGWWVVGTVVGEVLGLLGLEEVLFIIVLDSIIARMLLWFYPFATTIIIILALIYVFMLLLIVILLLLPLFLSL